MKIIAQIILTFILISFISCDNCDECVLSTDYNYNNGGAGKWCKTHPDYETAGCPGKKNQSSCDANQWCHWLQVSYNGEAPKNECLSYCQACCSWKSGSTCTFDASVGGSKYKSYCNSKRKLK